MKEKEVRDKVQEMEIYNASKEVLELLGYFAPDILDCIPQNFNFMLKDLASKANICVKINYNKRLDEQNISETGKDLIALIYYSYVVEDEEKIRIKENWENNN